MSGIECEYRKAAVETEIGHKERWWQKERAENAEWNYKQIRKDERRKAGGDCRVVGGSGD